VNYQDARGVMVQDVFVATRALTVLGRVDILLHRKINAHGVLEVESSAGPTVAIVSIHLDTSLQRNFSALGVAVQGSFVETHAIIVPIQGDMWFLKKCNAGGVLEVECSVVQDATIVAPRVSLTEEGFKVTYSSNDRTVSFAISTPGIYNQVLKISWSLFNLWCSRF
jgi:hypothetical protein